MISVFDIFKIGIGPSSSHTVGPMKAGKQFTDDLIARGLLAEVRKVVVDVYGSLSLTGKGHHTDIAIIMGLAGNLPDTVDIDAIPGFIQDVNTHGRLMLANGQHEVDFPVDQCMNFHADNLSLHENGMRITALAGDKVLYSQTYYSIGGGFIVDEEHFGQTTEAPVAVPYPYKNAADLQRHCRETGLSLSGLMMQNELALHSKEALEQHFAAVWEVMSAGIERGITTEGVLPGKLRVPRRRAAPHAGEPGHHQQRSDGGGRLDQYVRPGGERRERRRRPGGDRANQRRLRYRAGGAGLLRQVYPQGEQQLPGPLYAGRQRDWFAV